MNDESIIGSKILIVDDVPDNREILEQILELEGYDVVQVPSGEVALEIAPRTSPDLILLDIMMPGIDGFETCRRLKSDKATRNIPVIFITARTNTDDAMKTSQAGGVDHITKPFKEQEIRARVKTQLLIKLLRDTLQNHNQILNKEVKERTKELYEDRLEIIQCLVRATEYCDNVTGLHITRIRSYCGLLGHAYGMNEAELDLFINACAMHDSGKIGIPDSILLKPGRLDPDELKIMKSHVNIGTEILSGSRSDLMNMAKTIALTHHEKWDGTGYINGLKGEDIPLEGRICTLCDAFDAMTTDRHYRKALSIEDAMAEIELLSSKHFDPHLVKLFKQMLPEIRVIKERFADQVKDKKTFSHIG